MKHIFILLIKFYRKFISPLSPGKCRFIPTCSAYSLEAVNRYGAFKGGIISMKRILKCNPFGPFGFDPVPEPEEVKNMFSLKKKTKGE